MINHASNVLICLQKRNYTISWVVQSWAVKALVTKSETFKGNIILYFLAVTQVKLSLTLGEKLLKKMMFCILPQIFAKSFLQPLIPMSQS